MKKIKLVPTVNFNVLIPIHNLTSALKIQMEVSHNLVNLNRIMKLAMKSHILTSQKLCKILRMNHVPQSLKSHCRENDIIFCGSKVTSGILNRVISPQKSTTEVVICPNFQNFGLRVKSSSDKPKESVYFIKSKIPDL